MRNNFTKTHTRNTVDRPSSKGKEGLGEIRKKGGRTQAGKRSCKESSKKSKDLKSIGREVGLVGAFFGKGRFKDKEQAYQTKKNLVEAGKK